jgi:NAD(P)-dependent dehydrogenase (short-subunit alcohol dehydrogenase family)
METKVVFVTGAPGPIETEMLTRFAGSDDRKAGLASGVPLKRLGLPHEIAEANRFVASAKASFISGASFPVNGGKAAL